MINVTLETLLKFFNELGCNANIQKETGQIYFIFNLEGREYPLFARIFGQSELLQLLVFIPSQIKPETQNDVARLLHLLNRELDIPGFGMDEDNQVAFYRCMLPIPEKKIDPELLKAYLKSIELICKEISPPVLAIASGAATYADILRAAKEHGEDTRKPRH